jgi:hypothetical protein
MDPLDHLLALPDGLRCTVCDERVPVTRIRTLARRDDLTFIEIDCEACASSTLGFLLDGRAEGSIGAAIEGAPATGDPITTDDVLDMHALLSTWHGDLAGLLAGDGHDRAGPTR